MEYGKMSVDDLKINIKRSVVEIGERFYECEYKLSDTHNIKIVYDYLGTDKSTVKFRISTIETNEGNYSKDEHCLTFPLDKHKGNSYFPKRHWRMENVNFCLNDEYGQLGIEYTKREDK